MKKYVKKGVAFVGMRHLFEDFFMFFVRRNSISYSLNFCKGEISMIYLLSMNVFLARR